MGTEEAWLRLGLMISALILILFTMRLSLGRNQITDHLGLEFIWRKFKPVQKDKDGNEETLPTGFIWLVGIYVAILE